MTSLARRLGLVAFLFAGVLLGASTARAQFNPYVMPKFNPLGPANPLVAPTTLSSPATPSAMGAYDPYYPTPYQYGYYPGPVGGALMGLADVYRASGQVAINIEQARSLREQSIQAKFETQRKRFELDLYIKANTPTLTEELTKVTRNTLKRIYGNSTAAEISSGKALNVMLEDARKFPTRRVSVEQANLGEDILRQLNVTASHVGIGPLRDDGKIKWSVAVLETVPAEQLKTLETQARALMQGALNGNMDANVFRDFGLELDRTYDNLVKRVNDIAGPQYLEAKRFLADLKDARTALGKGEAQRQAEYQKFVKGGKNVQDVVDFLISKGWQFAPATAQDDAAYRAFYSAFVVFDVALNTQGSGAPPPPEPKESK